MCEVTWAGTSASGRFSPAETSSTAEELFVRLRELRSRGEGYLEVGIPDLGYPMVSIGFRDGHAVLHRADGPESMALLRGDSSVPSDAVVEVLIMDDLAEFTGDFVLTIDHAWRLMQEFVRTREVVGLGEWCEL